MRRIGFVTALPAEAASLHRRRLDFGGLTRVPGGHLLTVSGTGPRHARQAALRLLDQGATALVSWGCAAALDANLQPGGLLVPESILGADGRVHCVDTEWRNQVLAALSPAVSPAAGVLAESPEIVADSAAKQALHAATGAVAVDMESAAIAGVAGENALPFLAVRAIADSATMKLPPAVFRALTPRGEVRLPVLLVDVLRHPGQVGELIRLGRAFSAAMASLRRARSHGGEDFCSPTPPAGG